MVALHTSQAPLKTDMLLLVMVALYTSQAL